VYAHADLFEELTERVLAHVRALGVGDPRAAGTDVGPLINVAAAERVESWVGAAVAAGGKLRTGGTRDGATVSPTVLTGVPESADVMAEEVFGPVVSLSPVASIDEGLRLINDSRFGLQAGVFTKDLATAFDVSAKLQVGGVVIGDVPSFRADQMPYGGVKDSGVGREGPASAMADFTEERVTILTGLTL
jgi:acyl-CoA reductase-like NAD-dependent aldehyde dehydrogenase